jgi:hypothetical protein
MKDLFIRASSLPTMFDCAARWAAQNIEGLRTPNTGPAHLGTSLHHASAVFDQARVDANPITTSDAIDVFVDRVKGPGDDDGEIIWESNFKLAKAVDVGVRLTMDYCENHSPRYEFSAIEVKCESLVIDMDDGVKLTLTGQADRVRTEERVYNTNGVGGWWQEEPSTTLYGISDVKSGKRIIASDGTIAIDKHVAQLGQYELIQLLAKQELGYDFTLPAQVIAFPTSGTRTEVATAEVESPSRILLGDEEHPQGLLHMAAKMAAAELFPGNPKSMMCSEKYCPIYATCWWRGVKRVF